MERQDISIGAETENKFRSGLSSRVWRYLGMTVFHKDIGIIMVDAIEHDLHTENHHSDHGEDETEPGI